MLNRLPVANKHLKGEGIQTQSRSDIEVVTSFFMGEGYFYWRQFENIRVVFPGKVPIHPNGVMGCNSVIFSSLPARTCGINY